MHINLAHAGTARFFSKILYISLQQGTNRMNELWIIFLLIFFILCFVVIIWLQSKDKNTAAKPDTKERVVDPRPPLNGAEVTSQTIEPFAVGEVIELGTELCTTYVDFPFGTHATDIYYDIYEKNELDAVAKKIQDANTTGALTTNDAPPMPDPNASSCNPTTPFVWDKDNVSLNPDNVLWGKVSKEASKSIALKACMQESVETAVKCGDANDMQFCYHSPIFKIDIHDPTLAFAAQFAENTVMAGGQAIAGFMPTFNGSMTIKGVGEDWDQLKESRKRFMSNTKEFFSTGSAKTISTTPVVVGDVVTTTAGRQAIPALTEQRRVIVDNQQKMFREVKANNANMRAQLGAAKGGVDAAIGAIKTTNRTASKFGILATLIVAGSSYAFILALYAVQLLFGILPIILMFVEAFLEPLMRSAFRPGGVCPVGYFSLKQSMGDELVQKLVEAFLPAISTLNILDTYICWKNIVKVDPGKAVLGLLSEIFTFGLADISAVTGSDMSDIIRLKILKVKPSYMYDRSLSVIYHASWISNGGTPPSVSPTSGNTGGSGSSTASEPMPFEPVPDGWEVIPDTPFIGTICPPGTISENTICIPDSYNIDVQNPTLVPCTNQEDDDGTNCWKKGTRDPTCTGGIISVIQSPIYNDVTGYMQITQTPYKCNGVDVPSPVGIMKTYNERIICPAGYEKEGILCYNRCEKVGYKRIGAKCVAPAEGVIRTIESGKLAVRKRIGKTDAPPPTVVREPTYDSEVPLNNLPFIWCDFADPKMLDKMATFYNVQAIQNPDITYNKCGDTEATVQKIIKFYGVIASSELSCDVACNIIFTKYDPISGKLISVKPGCSYPEDNDFKDYHFCYRRFYFIYSREKGEFIVTGCTHVDYTAPDAMVKSVPGASDNFLVSLSEPTVYTGDAEALLRRAAETSAKAVSLRAIWEAARAADRAAGRNYNSDATNAALDAYWPAWQEATNAEGAAKRIDIASKYKNTNSRSVPPSPLWTLSNTNLTLYNTQRAEWNRNNGSAKTFMAVARRSKDIANLSNMLDSMKNGSVFSEIAGATAVNALSLGIGMKAGQLATNLGQKLGGAYGSVFGGLIGGAVGGAAAGMGAQEAVNRILTQTNQRITSTIDKSDIDDFPSIVTQNGNTFIRTRDTDWEILQGAPYEVSNGYTPNFTSTCRGITTNAAYCTNKYVIRNMVDKYHELHPGKHLESITGIEPRGDKGCYYKATEYTYDIATMQKTGDSYEKEIVQVHQFKDMDICTFEPISGDSFDESIASYPIRNITDIMTNITLYPFRVSHRTSDLTARFVRIRPPVGSTNRLQLTEIEIYDVSGTNVAVNRPTYSTSADTEYASAQSVVDGNRTPGQSKLNVWAPTTTDTNPYWEVDLGKNINIAEVIYYGGDLPDTNHIGVRIEFLYSNAASETPILTKTLTAETKQAISTSVHVVSVYASSITKSKYPRSGSIKLPPLNATRVSNAPKYIGNPQCIQRCEDADVMSRFMNQYNNTHDNTQIMRMFRGTNGKDPSSCEYEVEMKTISDSTSGSGSGSVDPLKRPFTLEKQYVNMSINMASSQPSNVVLGRYVRIRPNNSPNNVLEISHIVVTNNDGYRISSSKPINCNNEIEILDDIAGASNGGSFVAGDQCVKSVVNGYVKPGTTTPSFNPEYYPNLYIAKNNDASTFFQIDLLSASTINQIMFVGRNDTERVKGGIKGIQVEVYVDDPSSLNARPVFTYSLPTDDVYQTINVWRPIQCAFDLQSSQILEEPVYLNMASPLALMQSLYTYDTVPGLEGVTQNCGPPQCRILKLGVEEEVEELEIPDTYEQIPGVGAVSNIMSSLKSTWNSFLPKQSEELVTPIVSNLKVANSSVKNMADTVADMQTIAGTDKRCKDREVLTNIMMHYNNLNAPKQDGTISANVTKEAAEKLQQQYGSTKKTMLRILKAGQSTPNTCDIMYEESVDMYDDYIEDIVNKDYAFKQVKAARFVMNGVVPDSDPKRVTDISANALGIMSDRTVVNPPFSSKDISPACVIDCRDPNIIEAVRAKVNSNKHTGSDTGGAYTETYTLKTIKNSFQPSPYVCEYTIIKDGLQKYNTRNASYADPNVETYVRGVFSTDPAPTCSHSVVKIEEYDPEFVSWTNDNYPAKYKGVNSIIPYIYSYNPVDPTKKDPKNLQKNSVRVNSQSQNI